MCKRSVRLRAGPIGGTKHLRPGGGSPVCRPPRPQRPHEPRGRHARNFDRIAIGWLRRGLQWYCKVGLETGGLSWGTVQLRIDSALVFDAFLAGRDVPGPWLADEPDQVRALLLDFLGHVRGLRVQQPGPTHGQPLSQSRVSTLLGGVEQFYLFMHDHRETTATSLAEPGWLRLGVQHAVLFRRGDKPRRSRHHGQGRDVIDADAFTQIMAGAGLLGTPAAEGGLGDEQAMRILMLLASTGRRVSEICMLDHDPLLPLHQPASSAGDAQGEAEGFVARLRYQQTKIDGAPDTILVDREIVAIIRAQHDWVRRARPDAAAPKYLFVAARNNRHGDRPYSDGRLRERIGELARRLDIRDTTGVLVDFQRTHRFRHTKATTLLNAGVPLHVVQRYLGHYAGDLVKWIMSGCVLVESGEQSVEDLLAAELSFVDGVVALGPQGGAELDGGLEEGAGLADRLEVAVQPDWSGAVAVAEHAAVHLGAQPAHLGAFSVGGQFFRRVVERLDLLADGEVLLGDGAIGDTGVNHGHPHRAMAQKGGDRLERHAPRPKTRSSDGNRTARWVSPAVDRAATR